MGKTREFSSISGTERPGRGEKWKRRARGLGALALSVAVAFGLYHEAHKPAMDDEQMRDMTDNVRAVVLNKAEEIRKDGSMEGGSYLTGDGRSLRIDVAAGNTSGTGVGETADYNRDEGMSVELCLREEGNPKYNKADHASYLCATFSSEDGSALRSIETKDGKVAYDKAIKFVESDDASISRIYYSWDSDENGRVEPFECPPGKGCRGDLSLTIYVNKDNGVDKIKEGVYSGDGAVRRVDELLAEVEDRWDN
jgi:hypothetical protein